MVELAEIPQRIAEAAHGSDALVRARLRAAGICMIGVALGASMLPFYAVGSALGPMMLEFDWTAEQVHLSYALMMWAGALAVWPIGILVDRVGARPVVAAGAAGIAVVSLMLPLVHGFSQFCVLVALLGVLGSSGLGYSRVVAGLFGAHRGLAMGVLAAEGFALSKVVPLVMGRLVLAGGWRGAFTAIGLAMLALAPLVYFGLASRRRPSPLRRFPAAQAPEGGVTALQAARDPVFWIIVAASVSTAAMGGGVISSFGPAMTAKGFDHVTILRAAPITLMAALAGAICSGALLDRVRSPRIAAAAYLATAATYLIWWLATPGFGGEPMLIAGLALGAFGFTAQAPLVGYLFSRYFGLSSYGAIFGLQAFLQPVTVALGASVIAGGLGLIGGYHLVFAVGMAAQVLAALLYLLLPPYRRPATGEDGEDAAPDLVPILRVRSS